MLDLLLVISIPMGLLVVAYLVLNAWERRQRLDFDINEGIEPAVDPDLSMRDLLGNPGRVDALRGKVSLVAFNDEVDTGAAGHRSEMPIAESWLVDSNGASITLETTVDTMSHEDLGSDGAERGGPIRAAKTMQAVDRRNVEIEENARWLADRLGVPFES